MSLVTQAKNGCKASSSTRGADLADLGVCNLLSPLPVVLPGSCIWEGSDWERILSQVGPLPASKKFIKARVEVNVSSHAGSRERGRTEGEKGSSLNSWSQRTKPLLTPEVHLASSVRLNLHSVGTRPLPLQDLGELRSTDGCNYVLRTS